MSNEPIIDENAPEIIGEIVEVAVLSPEDAEYERKLEERAGVYLTQIAENPFLLRDDETVYRARVDARRAGKH